MHVFSCITVSTSILICIGGEGGGEGGGGGGGGGGRGEGGRGEGGRGEGKYSSYFLYRFKVTKGFYGMSDQITITMGDHFNFHFLKHTAVGVHRCRAKDIYIYFYFRKCITYSEYD